MPFYRIPQGLIMHFNGAMKYEPSGPPASKDELMRHSKAELVELGVEHKRAPAEVLEALTKEQIVERLFGYVEAEGHGEE